MSQSEVQVRWVIREGRELGKEGRMWELTKGGLSVGRSGDRDIQVLVSTWINRVVLLLPSKSLS